MSETVAALSTASRNLWRALRHNWASHLEQWALRLCPKGELLAMVSMIAERDAAIELLQGRLPDGMQHCTIQFKECEQGHGRLTATNWVQHGCSKCEIDRLRSSLEEVAEGIYKPGTDAWEVVHQMREIAKAALGHVEHNVTEKENGRSAGKITG